MKRIAFLDYNVETFGGVEKVLSILANELSAYYEVYIFSITSHGGELFFPFNDDIRIFHLGLPNMRIRQQMIHGSLPIRELIKQEKIECILFMGHYSGFLGGVASLGAQCKKIFCDHGALINQIDDKKATFMRRFAYMVSDVTIALTMQSVDDYIKIFKAKKEKLRCIYNPIEFEQKTGAYNKESKKLVTAGRLSEEKGFDLLVEVACILREKNSDWKWDIWGDGSMMEMIAEKIQEYHLNDYIFLKGKTSNMEDKYKEYAMYVLPSYREGLPMCLLEAQANQLPIVSFDIYTGPREIVSDNKNGFLIEPYDIEKMAERIDELLSSPSKREEFSLNSQVNIGKFDKQSIIKQWIEVIEEKI